MLKKRWAALLSVGALMLAGPGHAQQKAEDDVVRIGVLTDMSGQFSHESGEGSVTAVRMAIEDFGGKVLNRKIELLVADHQNKNEVAVATARNWYDQQKVLMIQNLINSAVALAVANVAREKDRIAIVNGSGSSRLTNDACTPNSIHYSYDTYALAKGTGSALVKQGYDSWFFLTADYAFGHALESDTAAFVKRRKAKSWEPSAIRSMRPTTRLSCFRRRHPTPRSSPLPAPARRSSTP
jgi:branched-chain amino acid transport system substrate-binding protein